jgi:heme/copper-type cytochrome/quinol oxidase subunit 4
MGDKQIGISIMIILTMIPWLYILKTGKKTIEVNVLVLVVFVALYALGLFMAFKR